MQPMRFAAQHDEHSMHGGDSAKFSLHPHTHARTQRFRRSTKGNR